MVLCYPVLTTTKCVVFAETTMMTQTMTLPNQMAHWHQLSMTLGTAGKQKRMKMIREFTYSFFFSVCSTKNMQKSWLTIRTTQSVCTFILKCGYNYNIERLHQRFWAKTTLSIQDRASKTHKDGSQLHGLHFKQKYCLKVTHFSILAFPIE